MKITARISLNPVTKYRWAILFRDTKSFFDWIDSNRIQPYDDRPEGTRMVPLKFDTNAYHMSAIFVASQRGVSYAYR